MPQPFAEALLSVVQTDSVLNLIQEGLMGDVPALDESFPSLWSRLLDAGRYVRLLFGLGASVALSSTIAFHPVTSRRALNLDELEQPKTLLIYGIVGAMVAQIVVISPPMALVVFGIGGLLRFRTNVGAAQDTGQVILVTVIGITCGMGLYPLALVGTGSGWLLIFFLGRRSVSRVEIKGLEPDRHGEALRRSGEILTEHGFRVVRTRSKYSARRCILIVSNPSGVKGDAAEQALARLSAEMGTEIDWDGL